MTETDLQIFMDLKLSEIADTLMAYYNPCDIKGSSCRAGDPNPCCHNTTYGKGTCWFLRNGCCAPNAHCKLWLCKTAIAATDPKCVEALKLLSQVGKLYGLVRDPLIGHPYSGADKQPK